MNDIKQHIGIHPPWKDIKLHLEIEQTTFKIIKLRSTSNQNIFGHKIPDETLYNFLRPNYIKSDIKLHYQFDLTTLQNRSNFISKEKINYNYKDQTTIRLIKLQLD